MISSRDCEKRVLKYYLFYVYGKSLGVRHPKFYNIIFGTYSQCVFMICRVSRHPVRAVVPGLHYGNSTAVLAPLHYTCSTAVQRQYCRPGTGAARAAVGAGCSGRLQDKPSI